MFFASLEPEHLASHIKAADLATPVDEHPAGPYRATQNLIKVIGRLALTVYLRAAGESHRGAQEHDGSAGSISGDAADRTWHGLSSVAAEMVVWVKAPGRETQITSIRDVPEG